MASKEVTTKEISLKLQEVAGLFSQVARETILGDNFKKHVLEVDMLLKKSQQGDTILDVGGGMGVNLLCLRRLNPTLELHLIDRFEEYTEENRMGPSEGGLKMMREADISVVSQDFWKNPTLPYDSDYFDIVTCLDVFEHLPGHPLRLLEEINRVLKRQGIVVIAGPNSITLMHRASLLLGRYPYTPLELWCQDNYYSHYREYSPDECRKLLEMSGFGEIETIMVPEPSCRNRSQKGKYLGPLVTAAVWLIHLTTLLVPGLRPSVYCLAKKPWG